MIKKLIIAAVLVLYGFQAYAADAAGVTGAPYLNLSVGARPSGMGEAYTAVVDNVDAVWWNPGALVKVQNPQFGLMHNMNFGGTSYEYLAIGFPAEQLGLDIWGTIGITALLIGVEDVAITKESFDTISGNYLYSDYQASLNQEYGAGGTVLALSYSWQAAKMFAVGATIKVINQKVALEEAWVPALDIGILSNTNMKGFDLGLVFQNVSFMQMNQVDGAPNAPLPLNLKFGIGYKLDRLFTPETDPRDKLAFGIDGILPLQPANMPFKLCIGLEYMLNLGDNILKPRVGYRFNGKDFISDLGPLAGLTAGFGLSRNFDGLDVALDYAFIPYGDLGMSHRMGLTINVGQPTPTPTPLPIKPPKTIKLKTEPKKIWVMWSLPDAKDKNKDLIKGYNVYMSYKPGGKYYKLNKAAIAPDKYYLKAGPLKSGLRCYFVVTTVGPNDKESAYSKEISAVPR
jgi:hypothetical protein